MVKAAPFAALAAAFLSVAFAAPTVTAAVEADRTLSSPLEKRTEYSPCPFQRSHAMPASALQSSEALTLL